MLESFPGGFELDVGVVFHVFWMFGIVFHVFWVVSRIDILVVTCCFSLAGKRLHDSHIKNRAEAHRNSFFR